MGFDCLPLTRSGERVFIRECSRDRRSMCGVSSGGKRERTDVKEILPATDLRGDEDGVQRK